MSDGVADLLVVGGGINGTGIARDAVGRGLTVTLVEQDDLASGTSSWSTKLIHGGLRYLEYYEFRLVREALIEREVLWAIAPHIIRPLRFVLPHHKGLRPAWMLRLGLFMYDHLGGRKRLPATKTLDLTTDITGKPLKPGYSRGFEYSDCGVDDARLVVLNARDAADRGATILTRTKAVAAERADGLWRVTAEDRGTGATKVITAKALVNAAGPWVEQFLTNGVHAKAPAKVRLVQGSHIVVPKLYDHDRAYIFQNADNRIIFAIPYEGAFTLIGTTDQDYHGDPKDVAATPEEIAYLCSAASEYFTRAITPADVVWTYSGVRPLYDDGVSAAQEATRDYVLHRDGGEGEAPMISVFGGKITTYRRLAMSALELLAPDLPKLKDKAGWTAQAALPGGDFPVDTVYNVAESLWRSHPALDTLMIDRLAHAYGTRARAILEGVETPADMGRAFGAGLTEREIRYLVENEWAVTADDVLWRRSKLGLHLSAAEREAVKAHMGA
ncbi:glycerol-3-phosphate dehydrogenase [Phreatobacter aquaticus]|uniref:Glycerol-3-phosphate dehydrogenase n=1 Tax=Phreatobacter aquaticus TaxID=2570229 RepID=A0A4D7QDL6_9HYPH|nr:glycerol-3-phosphate dehydrogenase [Phreatobacter aquaticus]QCK85308.1 glycerol-3-phosphate dehydrogenase [Phreatobacter aquaticus]